MSVARHTAYNLAGAIIPMGVMLVTVPLYLEAIGMERYGVLALVWVLAGYFGFFDFGIGRATARKMATLASAPAAERSRLFWTSARITAALAIIAAIVFWPIAILFTERMDIPAALRPELARALPLLIAAVPVGVVGSLLTGTLEGRRAFGHANGISLAGNLLTAIIPLASAWIFGPDLALLIAASLIARLMVLAAQAGAIKRVVPLGALDLADRNAARDLIAFGGWATVSGVVGPMLVYFDRFAIGAWLGAAAIGLYVIGQNLISQMQVVPSAFTRAIFPRLSEMPDGESRERSIDAMRIMTAVVTPMTVVGMFAMTPFLRLWLGATISTASGPLAVILLLGFWANSIAFVALSRLQAMGRPDLAAKVHVAELLPYAAILLGAISVAGLQGAAAAWSIRCAADLLLLGLLAGVLRDTSRSLAVGALLTGCAAAIALTMAASALYWALAILVSVLTVAWAWATIPANLRNAVYGALKRPFNAVPAK